MSRFSSYIGVVVVAVAVVAVVVIKLSDNNFLYAENENFYDIFQQT